MEDVGAFVLNGGFGSGQYRSVATPKPPSSIPRIAAFTGFDFGPTDTAVCAASHQFAAAVRALVPSAEAASV